MNWRVRWDDILFGNPAKNHQLDNRVSATPHWAVLVTDHREEGEMGGGERVGREGGRDEGQKDRERGE